MLSVITSVGSAAVMRSPASKPAATPPSKAGAVRTEPKQVPSAVMRHVSAVWSRLAAWKMRRATRIILCSLDDRILNDIGLARSEIDAVLRDRQARTQRWPVELAQ